MYQVLHNEWTGKSFLFVFIQGHKKQFFKVHLYVQYGLTVPFKELSVSMTSQEKQSFERVHIAELKMNPKSLFTLSIHLVALTDKKPAIIHAGRT